MTKLKPFADGVNAYTLRFDDALLGGLRTLYETGVRDYLDAPVNAWLLEGGRRVDARWQCADHQFFACSYGNTPLLWVSNNDVATYDEFRQFFISLGLSGDVRQLVDVERDVVVYSGFFVVGNHVPDTRWHVDYRVGANALTLLAPLFDWDCAHGSLLYKDADSRVQKYRYRRGEAVVLGEGFEHSTEPYPKMPFLRVLVSLTFGTDRLKYWDVLNKTIGKQSEFLVLPCGHPTATCTCLADFEAACNEDSAAQFMEAMDPASSWRVAASTQVECRESEGQLALVDGSGRRVAALDAMGALMWRLIEQDGRLDSMRAAILAEYDVDPDQLARDLVGFLQSLAGAGLITLTPMDAPHSRARSP